MPIRISKHSKSKQVNLIPQDEFELSNLGRILKWALSTFRIMVIVTELIVMSAFLSRFWLDARNSDLNDEINSSKSLINAYKSTELEFRSLQTRINIAKSIYGEPKVSNVVSTITKLMPEDIILNSISVVDQQVVLKAASFSEKSIAQFLINIESEKTLEDVNLAQVSSNTDDKSITTFTINATVNGSKIESKTK